MTRLEYNIGGQQAAHGMSNEDDVCFGGFEGLEPCTEVVTGNLDRLVCFVSRIDLGVNDMAIRKGYFEILVNMSWKGLKRGVVPHKPVYVYHQEFAPFYFLVCWQGGRQRLSR